ncbi:hypothetical protein HMPREF9104_03057 [Lentilactobacillus kisonensis F0435]|uniref:Uncharacterized protein n=1 Tax=Lentilactobacillus kisonensis F0435 TaxID=797516 RepID=H1LKB1_9LACO|nr:hypothetical protein HMPREF9104_03057 [Lentilactobacillus kisonensis F0435]
MGHRISSLKNTIVLECGYKKFWLTGNSSPQPAVGSVRKY